MKICKTCDATKVFQDFYAHPKAKDGLDSTCKECRKEKVRINRESKSEYYKEYDCWRYANQPQVKERHKKYRKTDQGKSAINRGKALWANKNPEARAAHVILGNAVRDGRIDKPKCCPVCLEFKPSRQIHAHHDDYAKPLEVRWMCAQCHTKEHGRDNKY